MSAPKLPDVSTEAAAGSLVGQVPRSAAALRAGLPILSVKIPEAALMTSLSEKTLMRAIKRGDIRVTRKLRHKLIPISELERFLSA
jgi:hypothetical protein